MQRLVESDALFISLPVYRDLLQRLLTTLGERQARAHALRDALCAIHSQFHWRVPAGHPTVGERGA